MSYKIHLINYNHNSNVPLDKIFSKIEIFEHDYRVDFHFHFDNHKYLDYINAYISGRDYDGPSILFSPFIYDGDVCLNDLDIDEIDRYYEHPEYFRIEFVLPKCFGNCYDVFVTSLRWEYRVSIVKEETGKMVDCADIEIIDYTGD